MPPAFDIIPFLVPLALAFVSLGLLIFFDKEPT